MKSVKTQKVSFAFQPKNSCENGFTFGYNNTGHPNSLLLFALFLFGLVIEFTFGYKKFVVLVVRVLLIWICVVVKESIFVVVPCMVLELNYLWA